MLKDYIKLTKPGIIVGNLVTACGGFFMASKGKFFPELFFSMLCGLSLVIASGCVFNNFKDRFIDAKMTRTKNRPLVKGSVNIFNALCFGAALLILGLLLLHVKTNPVALWSAVLGFIFYVYVYTPIKQISSYGTLVGSISGAIPPVCGYCAFSGSLDLGAFLLFSIITAWQMPHFYAISVYRQEEYKLANVPVLPLVRGLKNTKVQMNLYTALFLLTSITPYFFGHVGKLYFVTISALGLYWLYFAFKGFKASCDIKWAKTMFRFSLIIIMAFSLMLVVDTI
jgi:protoheme IX farnesyltransferase